MLLNIHNLNISFKQENKKNSVVKNFSLEIPKGKIIGIVGESGSGKSVSSLSIMKLVSKNAIVDSGEIILNTDEYKDLDILKADEKLMRKIRGDEISMIFQEPMTSLNPIKKCGEQVSEIIRLHRNISNKEAKKITIDLFNEVQIPRADKIFNSYPHQVSGGQKQRIMIAMALANKPKLLIADEPTTALDVTVQKKILEILKDLQQKYEMSVIFITHDLGVVAELADDIVVMKKGEIVEKENLARDYNIYIFHGTDGDDWDTDGKESLPQLEKMLSYASRVGISIAEHTQEATHNTEVEKYLKKSGLLTEKAEFIRLDVMPENAGEPRLIEGIKHLISE